MDRKKKVVGIAVVLLMAVSSMVYAGNKEEKGCPCVKEVNNGCIPAEPQMSREPIEPRDCGTRTYYEYRDCKWRHEPYDTWVWQLCSTPLPPAMHCHFLIDGDRLYCKKYKVWYDSCFGEVIREEYKGEVIKDSRNVHVVKSYTDHPCCKKAVEG